MKRLSLLQPQWFPSNDFENKVWKPVYFEQQMKLWCFRCNYIFIALHSLWLHQTVDRRASVSSSVSHTTLILMNNRLSIAKRASECRKALFEWYFSLPSVQLWQAAPSFKRLKGFRLQLYLTASRHKQQHISLRKQPEIQIFIGRALPSKWKPASEQSNYFLFHHFKNGKPGMAQHA